MVGRDFYLPLEKLHNRGWVQVTMGDDDALWHPLMSFGHGMDPDAPSLSQDSLTTRAADEGAVSSTTSYLFLLPGWCATRVKVQRFSLSAFVPFHVWHAGRVLKQIFSFSQMSENRKNLSSFCSAQPHKGLLSWVDTLHFPTHWTSPQF